MFTIIINSSRATQGPTALMSWHQQRQGSAGAHRLGAGTRRWPDCSGELAPMTQGSADARSLDVYY